MGGVEKGLGVVALKVVCAGQRRAVDCEGNRGGMGACCPPPHPEVKCAGHQPTHSLNGDELLKVTQEMQKGTAS